MDQESLLRGQSVMNTRVCLCCHMNWGLGKPGALTVMGRLLLPGEGYRTRGAVLCPRGEDPSSQLPQKASHLCLCYLPHHLLLSTLPCLPTPFACSPGAQYPPPVPRGHFLISQGPRLTFTPTKPSPDTLPWAPHLPVSDSVGWVGDKDLKWGPWNQCWLYISSQFGIMICVTPVGISCSFKAFIALPVK